MNLLDRYLLAVKKYLPWKRQDDILAELKANLESQLEEKESDLGRTLTTEEMQDWVKHLGSPMGMAARYLPQQYLIGPTIFPMYLWVLRLALLWCLVIYSVVKAVEIVASAGSGSSVLAAVLGAPWSLIITAAWVTAIFAAIEFATTHSLVKLPADIVGHVDWSPGTLPTAEDGPFDAKSPRSFSTAVAEVVFGFLALIWLLLVPHHPFLMLGPGAARLSVLPYHLAPVWVQFFWCIVAMSVVQLVWRSIVLVRGAWARPRVVQDLTYNIMGLIAVLVLFKAPNRAWILLKHPAVDAVRHGATLNSINHAIYTALLWAVAVSAVTLLWQIGRFAFDRYRKHVAA